MGVEGVGISDPPVRTGSTGCHLPSSLAFASAPDRERPTGGMLHGTWKATIRDQEGVLRGTLDIPVADDPVDVLELFQEEADKDGSPEA